jgi:ABC-2 type transport system ATP-binding protein
MPEHEKLDTVPTLVARDLERSYGGFLRRRTPALRGFSLAVDPGVVGGLVARNGSGKTTALRCCLGILRPHSGSVLVLGRNPRHPATRLGIGFVPERSDLHPLLTPLECLRLHGRLLGLGREERRRQTAELLSRLDLLSVQRRLLGKLSHGTVRRVSLALAFLGHPHLLLLDEPLSGVDPEGVQAFRDLLSEHRSRGVSAVLSSHVLSDLPVMADRLALLHEGRIALQGTLEELLAPGGDLVLRVRGLGLASTSQLAEKIRELGGELTGSRTHLDSLEDLYLRFVRGEDRS